MTEPGSGGKRRADALLVDRGLVATRSRAQALIMAGRVYSRDRRVDKAGALLPPDAPLLVRDPPRFVSRGGDKLEGALLELRLDVASFTCVDVGASTGGFTDCLLQRGAVKVYAVDVGHGQLDAKLRSDPRVVVMERTNARLLGPQTFAETIELVVVDASFIGIAKLLPAIFSFTRPGCLLLALVKPQFEAGRAAARRARGVIRDPEIRTAAIESARQAISSGGFALLASCDSSLPGPKGNLERFVLARRLG